MMGGRGEAIEDVPAGNNCGAALQHRQIGNYIRYTATAEYKLCTECPSIGVLSSWFLKTCKTDWRCNCV